VTNRFTALKAAQNEVTPEDLWKGTKTVLLEVATETIGSVKSQKKKKWISDETYAANMEKRETKGKYKNRYQELKAEVQRKLRVDEQQQLEGMWVQARVATFALSQSGTGVRPSPFLPPLPFLPFSNSLPSPLEVSTPPLELQVGSLGERSSSSSGFGRSPAAKRILVHFRPKFAPYLSNQCSCFFNY